MTYQNYHRHSMHTNKRVIDSVVYNEEYAKRAVELGQGILASTEHGFCGDIFECYELAEKYGLKFLAAAEAYWVKDRFEKDRSNCHIFIAAKNEHGRQELNEVLSEANETGFYYQPRLDLELLLKLPKDDVWISTACLAYWKYEDIDEITLKLFDHFKGNFYLEVQYHDTDTQREINRHIIDLSNKHNIPIIMGCDSHYIFPEQADDRTNFLNSKNLFYESEDGWFLDMPTGEEAFERFKKQGILNEYQIKEAIENTNVFLEVEEYNSPIFTKDIKMPTLYPDKTQEEKNKIFVDLIWELWEKEKQNVDQSEWDHYVKEISDEVEVIIDTFHADYFLLDYELVKKAVSMGGVITPTGRGCFTGDALINTKLTIKKLKDIVVGDEIITKDGKFEKVKQTFVYDIDEELVSIKHNYGKNKEYPNECTKDHLILINRDGIIDYLPAGEVRKGDYVCTPKIKPEHTKTLIVDMNDYNLFGFDYDDEYIYEKRAPNGDHYEYSINKISIATGVPFPAVKKILNPEMTNEGYLKKREKEKNLIFEYIPFNSVEEYKKYVYDIHTKKIKRFITVDKVFNQWIGMMYGDGWTGDRYKTGTPYEVGFIISSLNHKNILNRDIFMKFCEKLEVAPYEKKRQGRNFTEFYIRSKIVGTFVAKELFQSSLKTRKIFNAKWFNQSKENLSALLEGLEITDGYKKEKAISFNNTSGSITNAYKLLSLMSENGVCSSEFTKSKKGSDGVVRRDSFTVNRFPIENVINSKMKEDENFYFLRVTKTTILPKQKIRVYDLSIENEPSFLLNNMIVHNSGSSFYINKLLGFTTVDRISAPVPLIPSRFMSKSRILEAKSIADLDLNTSRTEIFAQAQAELLGERHSYPMTADGTLQVKGAWKMFSRANNIDPQIANDVSKQIDKYESAKKYADTEEEKEAIDIHKYIDAKYIKMFNESKKYLGIIDNVKVHACGYLLYMGDIRREIGLMMIKSATTKKQHLTCLMDGKYVEKYKFLKNDLLKVSVIDLIDRVFTRVGEPMIDSAKLIKLCENDKKVWDVYEMAATMGINQVEQSSTAGRVAQYKPQNISELTAFISAIRPGATSIFKAFSSREPFDYGIKTLDDLIQTKEFPYSFILYQETQMNILEYAGIPMDQTYEIIKSISKKRIDKIMSYKKAFLKGFEKKVMEGQNIQAEQASEASHQVWQIIEDSASYMYNCSHAYCVAIDSLYGAYLKSHYPLEFYEVFLQLLEEKGEKDRMAATKKEAERAYGIFFPPMRFRQNNTQLSSDAEKNQITNSLKSIKGFNKALADFLYSMKDLQFDSFIDFLIHIEENGTLSTKIGELIKIQYFEEFGKNGKLLELYEEFKNGKNKYNKKHTEKTKAKRIEALRELEASIEPYDMGIKDQMDIERELLGYIQCTYPDTDKRNCYVIDVDVKYAPRLTLFSLGSGKIQSIKIQKATFKHKPLVPGDIIFCEKFQHKKAVKKIGDDFVEQEEKVWWLTRYAKVNHLFM